MRARCHNPDHPAYQRYGGRGIKVCARWDDAKAFIADMGPRPPGYTLERKNNDGDYTPDNCVWASRLDQSRNRSFCKLTLEKAMAIRIAVQLGEKQNAVAARLGLSVGLVNQVVKNRIWKEQACS